MQSTLFASELDTAEIVLQIEQLLLANSGEDPFDEILKLIVAKLLDEAEEGRVWPKIMSCDAESAAVHLGDLLSRACIKWPGIFDFGVRFKLLPRHLVLCARPLNGVRIHNQDLSILDAAFEHLLTRRAKGEMGQYFTPRNIVSACLSMLNPRPGETLLDPACGSGGFLIRAFQQTRAKHGEIRLIGFDFDVKAIKVAKILSLVATAGHANILKANALDGKAWRDVPLPDDLEAGDSSTSGWSRLESIQVDIVATNPPFAGEVHDPDVLSHYELAVKDGVVLKKVDRDILFLERCVKFLRTGGRLAIVLPQGVFSNANTRYVREWLVNRVRLIGVIGLHPFAFLPHTAAKTSILLLEKGRPTSDSDAIFFATSQRSGKNSVGDLVINEKGLDHDLDDLANGFIEYAVQNRLGFIEGMTPSSTSPVSYDIAVKSFSAVRPTRRIDSEFFNPRLCAAEDNLRSRSSKTIADCVESNLERWKTNGFGDIHYFDISSVDPELGTATPTCLSASEAPSRAQYVLKKGDVLVSTVRPNRNAVALITLDFEEPMVASSGFCVLRSRSIPPEYLYAYCKSELFRQILTKYSTSSMYPTVSDQDILGMPLVEPEPEVLNRVVRDVKSAFSKLGEARHLLKKSSDITNETLGSTQCEQKIMADSTRR